MMLNSKINSKISLAIFVVISLASCATSLKDENDLTHELNKKGSFSTRSYLTSVS